MKTALIILLIVLTSCTDETARNPEKSRTPTKESKEQRRYESEIESLDPEKIILFSVIYKLDKNKIADIIALYETKIDYSDDLDFIEKVIDTIANTKNLTKEKVAKIIFSYKYELLSKQEIEDNYLDDIQQQDSYNYDPAEAEN